jgi:hypothetical protein
MLHRRPDKDSHLDTILYEIGMLRHCSKTLPAKKARKSDSDEASCEYNLVIEGFLIHLRNLIAFFTTQHSQPTDLRLDDPEVWYRRPVKERGYSDLRDRFRDFNKKYSETFKNGKTLDCYDLISKFLQHCTPERYEQAVVGWQIEKMLAEIEPILADFERLFPARTLAAPSAVPVIGITDSGTTSTTSPTSFRMYSAPIVLPVNKKHE